MTRAGSDHGLTLVELLVATAVTALIAPVLTSALVIGWRTTSDTVDRLGANRDRLLVPSLFTRDVQGSEAIQTSGPGCLQAGDSLVVRFTWTETNPAGVATTPAATWVRTGATPQLLHRRYCAGGTSVTSSVTASHDASSAVLACRDTAGGSVLPCSLTTTVVGLTVTDSSGATYTATGRRRLS